MGLQENAAYYQKVGALLTDWGWDDFLNWWPGWQTRTNSGPVTTPAAVTVHHTGGVATATSYLINPVDRPKLKVLANIHIDALDRRIRFICAGGASHGGYTYQPCYDRVIAGTAPLDRDLVPGPDSTTFSINRVTVGIEVDGAGGADEWDDWTYRAAVATAAACQLAAEWPLGDSPRVGGHKEHTLRKPGDPFVNMGRFRADVLACLAAPWGPTAGRPDFVLGDRVLSRAGNDVGSDVADLITLLIAVGSALPPSNVFDAAVEAAVIAFQTRHGLAADGVVRLDVVQALRQALTQSSTDDDDTPEVMDDVPAPVVQPPATRRKFRFGQANLEAQRFGGLLNISDDRGEFLRDEMKCSVYALCEVSENARNAIREVLGADRYKVWTVNFVCVLWDSTKWQHAGKKTVEFGTAFHGAVRVTLEDVEGSGLSMDVISIHVRPGVAIGGSDEAILKAKKSDIHRAMKQLVRPGVPTIVAGDFNTAKAADVIETFGFTRLTKAVDSLNEPGDQRLDATFASPGVKLRSQELIDPDDVSDHKVWLLKTTLAQAD
jgi:hypothetical protein